MHYIVFNYFTNYYLFLIICNLIANYVLNIHKKSL